MQTLLQSEQNLAFHCRLVFFLTAYLRCVFPIKLSGETRETISDQDRRRGILSRPSLEAREYNVCVEFHAYSRPQQQFVRLLLIYHCQLFMSQVNLLEHSHMIYSEFFCQYI